MTDRIKRINSFDVVKIIAGGALGFLLFTLTSHPKSPVNKKLPKVKVKNVSLIPSLKISRKNKIYHVHHWFSLPFLYIPVILLKRRLFRSKLLHGLILGGVAQGLSYKDRFKVVHHSIQSKEENRE